MSNVLTPFFASESIEDILRKLVIQRLGLPIPTTDISDDTALFAPASAGGLEIDSLSSLEILSGIADRFQMPLDDIEPSDFLNIATLSRYLRQHGVSS